MNVGLWVLHMLSWHCIVTLWCHLVWSHDHHLLCWPMQVTPSTSSPGCWTPCTRHWGNQEGLSPVSQYTIDIPQYNSVSYSVYFSIPVIHTGVLVPSTIWRATCHSMWASPDMPSAQWQGGPGSLRNCPHLVGQRVPIQMYIHIASSPVATKLFPKSPILLANLPTALPAQNSSWLSRVHHCGTLWRCTN